MRALRRRRSRWRPRWWPGPRCRCRSVSYPPLSIRCVSLILSLFNRLYPRSWTRNLGDVGHYYSAEASLEAEAPLLAGLPDGALMRRAAYGLADAIIAELIALTGGVAGRRVCAVVGSGDNGGDALWAATFLRRRGAAADAILLKPERTHRKGLAAFRNAGGRIVEKISAGTNLVIDGVVGISGSGPLRPDAAKVFEAVDAKAIPVVAVDIPSGIDVATGAVTGPAVHAALTVTFGGLKPVHALADCGRVRLVGM